MHPGDGPVFFGPSRPDDQAPVCGELINARKVLAGKEVACNRTLNVMGQRVRRFIDVVAPEGSLVPILDVLVGLCIC